MKLVAYLRVSTDRQADEGLGLEVQDRAIRAWARGQHKLVHVARDEGKSGSADVVDRPGLAEALSWVRTRRADGIVVYRVDRLARDLVLQELLLGEVRRMGGVVRSISPTEDAHLSDDPDDPTRALVRHVLGAVAQYERAMIRLRTAAGKRRKAEAGGYAGGAPPYGYRGGGGQLVPDRDELEVVRRIRRLRKAGRSYGEIADELNTDGLRTRAGAEWSKMAVQRVVKRHADRSP